MLKTTVFKPILLPLTAKWQTL